MLSYVSINEPLWLTWAVFISKTCYIGQSSQPKGLPLNESVTAFVISRTCSDNTGSCLRHYYPQTNVQKNRFNYSFNSHASIKRSQKTGTDEGSEVRRHWPTEVRWVIRNEHEHIVFRSTWHRFLIQSALVKWKVSLSLWAVYLRCTRNK